jgi:PPK2 family polyphosphate:nucleotide phosphotransferase
MDTNRFRVDGGKRFRLKQHDTSFTGGLSKDDAQERLPKLLARMADLQDRLYAQDQWALLLVFQAMDAAGKDSTIKNVMSGLNPQGCHVTAFKQPSSEELDHDFLWRCVRCLPERGRIGVFNRSYYEEVLVVRVHPELLLRQKLPAKLVGKSVWNERFEDIRGFERHLARSGTVVRKFFLNVSKKEQKRRFLARLDEPEKNWKFAAADVLEREHWGAYMRAYEQAIDATASAEAPWYVIPADHKWFMRLAVAEVIVETLQALKPGFPRLTPEQLRELQEARKLLEE